MVGHTVGHALGLAGLLLSAGGVAVAATFRRSSAAGTVGSPSRDRASLAAAARALFIGVKSGLALRNLGMLRDRVAPELHAALQARCDHLRAAKRSRRTEKIDIALAEVVDAWHARDREFAAVRLCGRLLDYTIDDATGQVLDGSRTTARPFEERWTFVRTAGARAWRLDAIHEIGGLEYGWEVRSG